MSDNYGNAATSTAVFPDQIFYIKCENKPPEVISELQVASEDSQISDVFEGIISKSEPLPLPTDSKNELFDPADAKSQTTENTYCELCQKWNCRRSESYHEKLHQMHSYSCHFCQTDFSRKIKLIQHFRSSPDCTHFQQKASISESAYTCSICDYVSRKKHDLINHLECHLGDAHEYVECTRSYKSRGKLRGHVRRKHERNKVVSCHFCGQQFADKMNLVPHIRMHLGDGYSCNVCSKIFHHKYYFIGHLRLHIGENLYKCSDCDANFPYKRYLLAHQKKHINTKNVACNLCGKKFAYERLLQIHMKVHSHQEKIHKCYICGMSFMSVQYQKRHILTHSDVKPFGCTQCGRKFARKEHVTRHMRTHTGEKPYVCVVCLKSFSQASALSIE